MEEKKSIFDLIKKSYLITKKIEKPDETEVNKVTKISIVYMLILGFLSIIISVAMNLIK